MESQQFTVLYTHQKMKKSKVWQDGILKISHLGNKAILYDDKGECLESLFLKCPEVRPGDDLEGDRYLVTVEDVRLAGSIAVNQNASKAAPASRPRRPVSSGWALRCPPAGLKRKFIGFQGPRQVPKKMVIENGESIASLETVNADPIFLSPFSNTPLLFSAAGKKAVNRILTDPENTVVHKDRKRKGPPPFSACSRSDPEVLWGDHLCSSVTSADEQSVSLLTSGPMQRDGLASHCLGVTQSIRSKAQILALLKSKSTSMYKEVNSEMTGHFPQVQPQGSLKFSAKPKCLIEQEESAEKKTESLQYQRLSEKTVKNKSRWAMYLSSQSSPVCDSAVDGNDPERKATAQGENINLNSRDRLVQKRIQFLETGAENGENCNEDTLVHSADPSWDQEGDVEISSLWERNVENDGLVSESDIQEDIKMPVNQNGQMCTKGSVLVGEKAQEIRSRGAPEKDCKQAVSDVPEPEHLQSESSLRDSFGVSDAITDMFSESNTDNESLGVIEPVSNVTQPVLEINFSLTNFETSDTEEECQESNKLSQDPEGWRKETLADDCNSGVQKRCEGVCCEEGASARLPLSVPTGAKLTETFPTKETLLSQVCGTTCAGFNTGPWNAGPTRDETERCSDSPLEWTNDVCVGNEDVTTSIQKVRSEYDFASLLNKSKGINSNLHIPRFLNIGTNQTPESSHSSEQTQHQSFIIESDLDKNDKQILPSISDSDNSIQLLNASQNHTEECIALDKPNSQVSNSLFYPLGREHPISKDTEAHLPESEDLGGIPTLPHDLFKVDTARGSSQYWSSPRNSSEPSGLVNSICLLKSLSEHNTALEGLEILKKKNTTFKQGALQTHEPENTPEAEKPLITVVLPAVSESHLNQDSQQCSTPTVMKENELEPSESLQSLQCFSLKSEEETAFPAVTPKPTERKTWDCQPVEFQGHQVQGSVTSAVMVRGHSSQLDCGQFPVLHERGSGAADTRSWAAELPSPGVQVDFFQVISPEQKVSTLSPESAFSLDSRDKDFMQEFSTESLKARTLPVMKKFHSLENQNLQRLPLVSRNRVPFVTVPPSDGPPDIESQSCAIACDKQVSSGSPLFHLGEESTILSLSSVPEDQSETSLSREVTAGNVALLDPISAPSKWLKYQNTLQDGLMTPSRADTSLTDFFAESTSGMCFSDTSERRSDAVRESSVDAVQMVRGMLRQQQQSVSTQDFVCRKKTLSLSSKPISTAEDAQNVLRESAHYSCSVTDLQEINSSELCFPSGQKIKSAYLPRRQILIPAGFQSPAHYKQIFTSCLIEHLNILLFGLAQRLHKALSAVDISFYTSPEGEKWKTAGNNMPSCCHHQPAKLVMVKKEGPNKGRLFYTCDAPKADQCKFFKWLEEMTPGHLTQEDSLPAMVLSDIKSLGLYLRSQKIPLYEECQLLVRKGFDFQRKQYGKLKKFTTVNPEFYSEPKGRLYLKLSRKETSSTYSKDDLWVVSKTLDFELDTFIACSAFFGPSSVNELELLPLKGYCPSSWPTNTVVHALLVCNASTELTSLKNIQDHFNPATLPLTPHLLAMSSSTIVSNKRVDKRKFIPPAFSNTNKKWDLPSLGAALQLASELIQAYKLNGDQAAALTQIARMVASQGPAEEEEGLHSHSIPITIIHGVFGAGKSYLLAVVILFFVQLFEKSEAPTVGNARPWKLLVSSSTNVAVDRVLLGLLSLGFEKFVRVGSVRKIAKPILPYSLHVGSENANEQLKELHALMKEDLTPTEKVYVRKSIEQHKLGTNRALLRQVRVVGVTCAACPFPCMNNLKFPVVVLDECSQMTEPTSLLPIARFECEKLILVGDPKQLPPTIQGSDAGHKNGLEQTLFDRLCLMGHKPVLLRTQYRCHPAIAAVASDLFYGGNLRNGVSETDRSPLLEWLPTLCFYNVQGKEQIEGGNSFHNVAEAAFTLKLIQSLVACGLAGSMIGVVTLYRSQMCKLCQLLSAVAVDCPSLRAVQVSTVDAFQGAEKEVIVLSCVRTRQVGFIDSEQRMNVALTRGRRHLLIVGNLACLRKNRLWECVIQHCEGREGGLQHARQCEPQLDRLLEDYFERRAEEKQKKKSGRDRSEDESHSQEGLV